MVLRDLIVSRTRRHARREPCSSLGRSLDRSACTRVIEIAAVDSSARRCLWMGGACGQGDQRGVVRGAVHDTGPVPPLRCSRLRPRHDLRARRQPQSRDRSTGRRGQPNGPWAVRGRRTQRTSGHRRQSRADWRCTAHRFALGYAAASIAGSLVDFGDAPLTNSPVEVAYRVKVPGATWTPAPPSTTDAAGRFSIRVAAGPSRTFRFRYAASEATTDVVVDCSGRPPAVGTNHAQWTTVRFNGRVPGSGAASTRVELQARADRRWVPFKTVLLRNGRFSGRYRFTRTTVTTRYRFRAVVKADPNFPYAPGTRRL